MAATNTSSENSRDSQGSSSTNSGFSASSSNPSSPPDNSQDNPGSSPGGDSSSSRTTSHDSPPPHSKQPTPPDSWINLPKLLIFKPFPAWNSPQIDERCFIYCSQSSRNRARGHDPWCRTICFRRVFGHEVHDGSYDASNDINGFLKPRGPLPLPHEGQPKEAFVDGEVEDTEKTRYWKEGRYIWVSKSRWGSQEKLDSMMANLPTQTEWMRHKEAMERQRYEEDLERLRQRVSQSQGRDSNPPEADDMDPNDDDRPGDDHRGYDGPEPPPPPPDSLRFTPNSAVRDSLLFPITPLSTMIQDALHQKLSFVLSPTYKLLTVFGRSFTEGTQRRFLEKAYQQATNGSTLTLVQNVFAQHESWWKELEERKEVEERKKKGGGSEFGDGGQ